MNIPDLPIDPVVDERGFLTDKGKFFFEQLLSQMQTFLGNEGLVAPTQSAANITTIQNNLNIAGQKTCAYGTIIYNSTANSIQIAVNNGSGSPVFKTVTLT